MAVGALGGFAQVLEHVFVRRAFHMAIHQTVDAIHEASEGFKEATYRGASFGDALGEAIDRAAGIKTLTQTINEMKTSLRDTAAAADKVRFSMRDFYREQGFYGKMNILGQDVQLGFKGTADAKIAELKQLQAENVGGVTNDKGEKTKRGLDDIEKDIQEQKRILRVVGGGVGGMLGGGEATFGERALALVGAGPGGIYGGNVAADARKKLGVLQHEKDEHTTLGGQIDTEIARAKKLNRPVDANSGFEDISSVFDRIASAAGTDRYGGDEAADPVVKAVGETNKKLDEIKEVLGGKPSSKPGVLPAK